VAFGEWCFWADLIGGQGWWHLNLAAYAIISYKAFPLFSQSIGKGRPFLYF
jgi:hypothetical protein